MPGAYSIPAASARLPPEPNSRNAQKEQSLVSTLEKKKLAAKRAVAQRKKAEAARRNAGERLATMTRREQTTRQKRTVMHTEAFEKVAHAPLRQPKKDTDEVKKARDAQKLQKDIQKSGLISD